MDLKKRMRIFYIASMAFMILALFVPSANGRYYSYSIADLFLSEIVTNGIMMLICTYGIVLASFGLTSLQSRFTKTKVYKISTKVLPPVIFAYAVVVAILRMVNYSAHAYAHVLIAISAVSWIIASYAFKRPKAKAAPITTSAILSAKMKRRAKVAPNTKEAKQALRKEKRKAFFKKLTPKKPFIVVIVALSLCFAWAVWVAIDTNVIFDIEVERAWVSQSGVNSGNEEDNYIHISLANKTQNALAVGESMRYRVFVPEDLYKLVGLKWSVSDSSVIDLDVEGIDYETINGNSGPVRVFSIHAKKAGTATITIGGGLAKEEKIEVVVLGKESITSEIKTDEISLPFGGYEDFEIVTNFDYKAITWKSTDSSVAAFASFYSKNKLEFVRIAAKGLGECYIIGEFDGKEVARIKVNVTGEPFTLKEQEITCFVGGTLSGSWTGVEKSSLLSSKAQFLISSKDEDIAEKKENGGYVKFISEGKVTLTIECIDGSSRYSKDVVVNVVAPFKLKDYDKNMVFAHGGIMKQQDFADLFIEKTNGFTDNVSLSGLYSDVDIDYSNTGNIEFKGAGVTSVRIYRGDCSVSVSITIGSPFSIKNATADYEFGVTTTTDELAKELLNFNYGGKIGSVTVDGTYVKKSGSDITFAKTGSGYVEFKYTYGTYSWEKETYTARVDINVGVPFTVKSTAPTSVEFGTTKTANEVVAMFLDKVENAGTINITTDKTYTSIYNTKVVFAKPGEGKLTFSCGGYTQDINVTITKNNLYTGLYDTYFSDTSLTEITKRDDGSFYISVSIGKDPDSSAYMKAIKAACEALGEAYVAQYEALAEDVEYKYWSSYGSYGTSGSFGIMSWICEAYRSSSYISVTFNTID